MTWSYSGDPASSSLDEVRALIGDVDESDPLVSDEIILFGISKYGSALAAASYAARGIANKFARLATQSVGGVSHSASDLYKQYTDMANRFTAQAGILCIPSFGGLTIAEHEADRADTSLVQAHEKRDQFDNPLAVTVPDNSGNKIQ